MISSDDCSIFVRINLGVQIWGAQIWGAQILDIRVVVSVTIPNFLVPLLISATAEATSYLVYKSVFTTFVDYARFVTFCYYYY